MKKKEKIKYYDPELAWERKAKNNTTLIWTIIAIIMLILGFHLGFMTIDFMQQLENLKNENYDQYVQIKSLEETIEKYERGEI